MTEISVALKFLQHDFFLGGGERGLIARGLRVVLRTSKYAAMVRSTDTGTSIAMISTLLCLEMFTRIGITVENICNEKSCTVLSNSSNSSLPSWYLQVSNCPSVYKLYDLEREVAAQYLRFVLPLPGTYLRFVFPLPDTYLRFVFPLPDTYLRFVLPLGVPLYFPVLRVGEEGQVEQREATAGRAARRRYRVTSAARNGTEAATLRGDLTR